MAEETTTLAAPTPDVTAVAANDASVMPSPPQLPPVAKPTQNLLPMGHDNKALAVEKELAKYIGSYLAKHGGSHLAGNLALTVTLANSNAVSAGGDPTGLHDIGLLFEGDAFKSPTTAKLLSAHLSAALAAHPAFKKHIVSVGEAPAGAMRFTVAGLKETCISTLLQPVAYADLAIDPTLLSESAAKAEGASASHQCTGAGCAQCGVQANANKDSGTGTIDPPPIKEPTIQPPKPAVMEAVTQVAPAGQPAANDAQAVIAEQPKTEVKTSELPIAPTTQVVNPANVERLAPANDKQAVLSA